VAENSDVAVDSRQTGIQRPTELSEAQQRRLRRHVDRLVEAANDAEPIDDSANSLRAHEIMSDHYSRLWAWHEEHDPQLQELWQAWRDARSPPTKDEAKARGFTDQIANVYQSFQPRYEKFIEQLAEVLTTKQIDGIKDHVTRSPGMMRTYNAYCDVIPEMTDEQKAFVLDNFRQAREEAMNAGSGKEVIELFKKYKVINEAYVNEQGYDWAKRYKAHYYPSES
jgi:hypothetical protein